MIAEWRNAARYEPTWLGAVVGDAYRELPELQVNSKGVTHARVVQSVEEHYREEFRQVLNGRVLSVGVLAKAIDGHVGMSWVVQWAYTVPEFRHCNLLSPLYRRMLKYAARDGLPYTYSKRTPDGNYLNIYGGF